MRIKTARTGNDNKVECSATLREIVQENRVHRRGVEHSSTVTQMCKIIKRKKVGQHNQPWGAIQLRPRSSRQQQYGLCGTKQKDCSMGGARFNQGVAGRKVIRT